MEVQKHPHHVTHKKKWTEYLLEFFMLFLAVFLGFVAENVREKQSEKRVEQQLLLSLVDDLKADTSAFEINANFWKERVKQIDSLRSCIKSGEKNNIIAAYYWAVGSFSFIDFRYHNGTIQQLRNTGNFRLLEKRKIVDTLIAYDGSVTNLYFNVEKTARDEYILVRHLQSSIFNSYYLDKFYNAYTASLNNEYTTLSRRNLSNSIVGDNVLNIPNDSLVLQGSTISQSEFYNELYNYKRLGYVLITLDESLKKEAVQLLALIYNEYNLSEEK